MRIVGYGSRCVCVSVCLLSHISQASLRPENAVMYSAGDEGRKLLWGFSETALFQSYGTSVLYGYLEVGHFLSRKLAREPAIIRAISTASPAQARE